MTYFSKNKNVQSQLYATGGATTLTLSGFYVNSVPLSISGLQTHFHSNFASNTALSNTAGFYPPGADNSLLYAPTVTSLAISETLSENQAIDANSRGFYVVVIGGGGGGGGGRWNTTNDNGNGGGGGGSGGLVGYYFNFADNGVSATGAYYRYLLSSSVAQGGAKGKGVNGSPGQPGDESIFRLFNSENTQIFDITCGGGGGGNGGGQVASAPFAPGGTGGTRTFTGTAANIASETTVNVTHSANGAGNNVNGGGS